MRKTALVALLVAGCGTGQPANDSARQAPAQTLTLVGLYEGGAASRPNRICIVEGDGGTARFGLVTWNGSAPGCSGAGSAAREGDMLRLDMFGDEACLIEARLDGRRVAFPAGLPRGCSYYCAPDAGLAGLAFAKTGGTEPDALRARDLVGDPLCGN